MLAFWFESLSSIEAPWSNFFFQKKKIHDPNAHHLSCHCSLHIANHRSRGLKGRSFCNMFTFSPGDAMIRYSRMTVTPAKKQRLLLANSRCTWMVTTHLWGRQNQVTVDILVDKSIFYSWSCYINPQRMCTFDTNKSEFSDLFTHKIYSKFVGLHVKQFNPRTNEEKEKKSCFQH